MKFSDLAKSFFEQEDARNKKVMNSSLYKERLNNLNSYTQKKETFFNNLKLDEGNDLKSKINVPTQNPIIEQKTNGRKLSGETEKIRFSF